MAKCVLIVFIAIALVGALEAQNVVTAPGGKPVMIDGNLVREQWDDSAELTMESGAHLYIKTSGEFAYIAVVFPKDLSGFTDLFIALEDGRTYDLHASAKLGERQLKDGRWPEWRDWWNNDGWVACVAR